MQSTNNFGLQKPEPATDNVNIEVLNGNMDIVDKGLVIYLGATSGSVNAYTISSDAIKALAEGVATCIKFHAASTAASTLNVNGWGAKGIKKAGGADVTNLKAGIYTLRYDGANFILQGEGASGDAAASDLLLGKKATTDAGEITGTMPDNGPVEAETVNLTSQNQEYVIALGKHSGLRKVKAMISGLVASVIRAGTTVGGILGTFTSDATAIDTDVLKDKTYYRNGVKGTGAIESKASATITPGPTDQTISAGQYLSGTQTIKSLGGNAKQSDVRADVTFSSDFAGRAKPGTMPVNTSQTATIQISGSARPTKTIPEGYTPGGTITAELTADLASIIVEGNTIGGITGTAIAGLRFQSGTTARTAVSNRVMHNDTGDVSLDYMVMVNGLSIRPDVIMLFPDTTNYYRGAFGILYARTTSISMTENGRFSVANVTHPYIINDYNYSDTRYPKVTHNGFELPALLVSGVTNYKWVVISLDGLNIVAP